MNYIQTISRKKIYLLIAFVLFIIPLIVALVASIDRKDVTPPATPAVPQPTKYLAEPLTLLFVSPKDGTTGVGIYPRITATFSRPLSSQEIKNIQITSFPQLEGKISLSNDRKTVIFSNDLPLLQDQQYVFNTTYPSGNYKWEFATTSPQNVPDEEQARAQTHADRGFGLWVESVQKQYPWYNKLPLQTQSYFVYFDLERKVFITSLYPNKTSRVSIDQQVQSLKENIMKRLQGFGIATEKYSFDWNVQPSQ